MSRENVELFRHAHEAFNADDIEGFLAYFDPSIEFDSAFAAVDAPLYGHDGLRRWRRELEDAWGDEIRVEAEVTSTSASKRWRSACSTREEGTAACASRCRSPTYRRGATTS